jgi:hypothetical protein
VFSSEVLFFSLVMVAYDLMYEFADPSKSARPKSLGKKFGSSVMAVGEKIRLEHVPANVLDAFRRAPVDARRRQIRHDFLKKQISASIHN